jgi:hypothetical protein
MPVVSLRTSEGLFEQAPGQAAPSSISREFTSVSVSLTPSATLRHVACNAAARLVGVLLSTLIRFRTVF